MAADKLKKTRYFTGQLLHQVDFETEQNYHTEHLRDHQRFSHTPGVAKGFEVKFSNSIPAPDPSITPASVRIEPGVAYDELGRRITLAASVDLDLTHTPPSGTESPTVYITASWDTDQATDASNETASGSETRFAEKVKIEKSAVPPPPNNGLQLLLAKVTRSGTTVLAVDTTVQMRAGVIGGNLEALSLTLTGSAIASSDWVKLSLTGAKQAELAGNLNVTQNITANGRNLLSELTAHTASTSNPHSTTAAQVDGAGGTERIVAQINTNTTSLINAARIHSDIARTAQLTAHTASTSNPHVTTAAQVDTAGGVDRIVAQINAGGGVINIARVQTLVEKLNGELTYGKLTLSTAGTANLVIANGDLRGRLITVRGWISSVTGATPSFPSTAQAMAWNPAQPWAPTGTNPAEGKGQESWALVKTSAPAGTSVALFSLVDQSSVTINVLLEFATTPQVQMILRMNGPASHTFGYVFQFNWQD
jgi:hypothetical protein